MNERGVFSYVFIFAIVVGMMVFMFSVQNPILNSFITGMFDESNSILSDTNANIGNLAAGTIKNETGRVIADQQNASAGSQSIVESVGKYGWFYILVVFSFAYLLIARRNVEYSGGAYGGM